MNEDPFDPEFEAIVAARKIAAEETEDEQIRRYIRRTREAYKEVFSPGVTSAEAIETVKLDLARFCRAFEPTFNSNPKLQDLLEGRREVFLRISDQTLLAFDELYIKFMRQQLTRG